MDGGQPARIRSLHVDGPLGRWRIDLCPPRAELRAIAEMLWYGEGRVNYLRDRILPSGGSYLLINLGPTQYRIDAGPPEHRVAFSDIWYSGPHTRPIDSEAPHGNALLGVALRACGSHAWIGVRADALAETTLSLSEVMGESANALRARLLECRDTMKRFELVEHWLLAHLRPRRRTHLAVEWALRRIAEQEGRVEVSVLASEVGFSRKHLAELFREQVGLTPKAMLRLERFRAALRVLEGATRVPWHELAARCGYFDQAHLSRDFKHFCGFAPGEFLRHQRADSTSIVLR